MITSPDQEIDIRMCDRECRRGKGALSLIISVREGVDQSYPLEAGYRLLSSDRTRGYGLVDQASGGSPSEIFVSCDAGVRGLESACGKSSVPAGSGASLVAGSCG